MSDVLMAATEEEPIRAPNDPPEDDSPCVACAFTCEGRSAGGGADFGCEDAESVHEVLIRLIREYDGKGSRASEVVDTVYDYYNERVRPVRDYGEWSKKTILEHILYHENNEELQNNLLREYIMRQIWALRDRTWVLDGAGNKAPHIGTLRAISDLTKTLKSLSSSSSSTKKT